MNMKKYLVSNNGGAVCVLGRVRIDIPAHVQDMPLSLPDVTASETVARLKQKFPLLTFRPVEIAEQPEQPKAEEAGSGNKSRSKRG